jgi:hypothetical protein
VEKGMDIEFKTTTQHRPPQLHRPEGGVYKIYVIIVSVLDHRAQNVILLMDLLWNICYRVE